MNIGDDAGKCWRVLLVDDHQIIRDSLEALLSLESGYEIAGQFDNGLDAVQGCTSLEPDIVVLDMDLPGMPGMDVIRSVSRASGPMPSFVILSMFGDPRIVNEALRLGAVGFVHKSSGLNEIRLALQAARDSKTHLCPRTLQSLEESKASVRNADEHELTPREREVLTCIAMGMSAKETARKLNISPATVHVFRARIREKLNVASQAEMVRVGIRLGLCSLDNGGDF
jgi:DNA-binding NarL/FixJ family response regulator